MPVREPRAQKSRIAEWGGLAREMEGDEAPFPSRSTTCELMCADLFHFVSLNGRDMGL